MITLKNNKSNLKIIQEITKLVTKSTIIITSLFIFQAAANNPTESSLDTIDVNNTAMTDLGSKPGSISITCVMGKRVHFSGPQLVCP